MRKGKTRSVGIEWKAKGRLEVTVKEAKTLRKLDDVRSSIGEW